MRQFLYLTTEFPPSRATGAIRPARFAAALPRHGWSPVIATLRDGRPALEPADTAAPGVPARGAPVPLADGRYRPQRFTRFPSWIPFGRAAAKVPAMVSAGRQGLTGSPCAAILVNAPPMANLLAGRLLARHSGLPLILDYRDPWGPCQMNGDKRPVWTRLIENRAERRAIEAALLVLLNTETARDAYAAAFPDMAAKLRVLRNAVDRDSLFQHDVPPFPVFTLLFAGRFTRHLTGAPLWALAEELWARGVRPDRLRIALTGAPGFDAPPDAPALALFERHGRHGQGEMGALMQAADALVLFGQPTRQKVPLKFYDYLYSDRPVLAVDPAENSELRGMIAASGMGDVFAPGETARMVDWVERLMDGPRHPVRARNADYVATLSLDRAAEQLAAMLDEVTG